jgi:voltage-gated potassium channel
MENFISFFVFSPISIIKIRMEQTSKRTNQGFRKTIFDILNNNGHNHKVAAYIFEILIIALILLSVASIIFESFIDTNGQFIVNEDNKVYWHYVFLLEKITIIVFITEYLLRILTADLLYPKEKSYLRSVLKFISSTSGIIDLIAIIPFIFHIANLDFRFIRVLKFTRLLKVFKIASTTRSIMIVGDAFYEKRNELGVTLFVTFVLMLVSATLMWYIEAAVQPEAFPNIVAAFWWAIATLTTVGYGDVYPITAYGKILAGIIAVLGIGIVALPTGILSASFIEKLEKEKEKKEAKKKKLQEHKFEKKHHTDELCHSRFGEKFIFCPFCGEKLDENAKHINQ